MDIDEPEPVRSPIPTYVTKAVRAEIGEEAFERHWVAYLDELGTEHNITKSFETETLRKDLASHRSMQSVFPALENPDARLVTKTFSDNIVIAAGDQYASFIDVVYRVGIVQMIGAINQRLYRGAIGNGMLYIDESHVIGPELVRVVRCEERTAVNPRVIVMDIPPTTLSMHNYTDRSHLKIENLPIVVDGSDGLFFVDYLRVATLRRDAQSNLPLHMLKRHGLLCIMGYQKARDAANERVLSKYKWLINYHNYSVKQARITHPSVRKWDVEITTHGDLLTFDDAATFRSLKIEDVASRAT